jgi:hypothetical protein
MRRIAAALVSVALLLGVVSGTAAATTTTNSGGMFAAGHGIFHSPYGDMVVSDLSMWAISTRGGVFGALEGSAVTTNGVVAWKAVATCLAVSGNHAILGGRIVRGATLEGGQGVVFFLEDNGRHISGHDGPDKLIGRGVPSVPTTCPPFDGSLIAPFDGEITLGLFGDGFYNY